MKPLFEEDQPGMAANSTGSVGDFATFDRMGNMSRRRNDEDEKVKDFFSEDDQQRPVEPADEEAIWDPMVAERLGDILNRILESDDPDSVDIDAMLDKDEEALFRRPDLEVGDAEEYDPEDYYDDEWSDDDDDDDDDDDEDEPVKEEQLSPMEFIAGLENRSHLTALRPTKAFEESREYRRARLSVAPDSIDALAAILEETVIEEEDKKGPSTAELIARKRAQAKNMKRRASRMKSQKKRKQFRTDYKTLSDRVGKAARKQVKDKLSGGKRKYSELSFAQKVSVDKKMREVGNSKVDAAKARLMAAYRAKAAARRKKQAGSK